MLVSFVLVLATPIVMAEEKGEEMKDAIEQVRHYFDHFVVGISDLDKGMNLIEEMTGVRPVYGGVHPTIGTHNALISLGDHTYLEIIAPNPDADFENLDPALKAEFMEPLKQMTALTPFLWAVGSSDLARTVLLLQNASVSFKNLMKSGLKLINFLACRLIKKRRTGLSRMNLLKTYSL